MKNSGNAGFLSFKVHVLSGVRGPGAALQVPPGACTAPKCSAARDPARWPLSGPFRNQVDCLGITVFAFKSPLLYVRMAPEAIRVTFLRCIVRILLFDF